MNAALDVHVVDMPGFDPKQARHVYDMATLYESEEDQEGHIVLLVANDLGKLVEVPAAECVVHHPTRTCAVDGCTRHIGPYSGSFRNLETA